MDNLLNWGIQFILWLQNLGSWLNPILKFFTFLGDEKFYLLVAPTILWCIDATLGLRMGLFLMTNSMINGILKVAFHAPRPFWYTSKVRVFGVFDESFGLPSGHSQNGVVVWGTLANQANRRWAWVVASIIIFLIGVSRLYFAVHFPSDVLVGWILGAALLFVFLKLEKPVVDWMKNYTLGAQIVIAFIASLFLIALFSLVKLSMSALNLPAEWVNNASAAFPNEDPINPLSTYGFMANPGAFFGLAAGWIWLSTRGGFTTKDIWWKLIVRYFVGIAGVMIVYFGLGAIFPDTETLLAYFLRYFRYALIGFWCAGLAPYLFVKMRLANQLRYRPEIEKAGQQAPADLH